MNVCPPSVLTCHWTLARGSSADAENTTAWPTVPVWPVGEVTVGPAITRTVAAGDTVVLVPVVTRARYWWPESPVVVASASVSPVAPERSVQVRPSVLVCHCTAVGVVFAWTASVTVVPGRTEIVFLPARVTV